MKNIMNRILNSIHNSSQQPLPGAGLFLLVFLFAGCSLYMEEVPDAEADPKDDVEGYDEPVHLETDEYEMTYQFKDSTLVISDRILNYLVAIQEEDSVTCSVYFSESMPTNLLPVEGGYIHCESSEDRPYLAHKVESVTKENGMWHVVAKFNSPFEIFETIDLYGSVELTPNDDPESGVFLSTAESEEERLARLHSRRMTRHSQPRKINVDFDSNDYISKGLFLGKSYPEKMELVQEQKFTESPNGKVNWSTGRPKVELYNGPYLKAGVTLKPVMRIYYNGDDDEYEFSFGIAGGFIFESGFILGQGKISGDLFEPIMIYGKSLKVGPLELGIGVSFSVYYEISGDMVNIGYGMVLPFEGKIAYSKTKHEKEGSWKATGKAPQFNRVFNDGMTSLSEILLGNNNVGLGHCTFSMMPKVAALVRFDGKIPRHNVTNDSFLKMAEKEGTDKFSYDGDDAQKVGLEMNVRIGPEFSIQIPAVSNMTDMRTKDFLDIGLYLRSGGSAKLKAFGFNILDIEKDFLKIPVGGLKYTIPSVPIIDDRSFYVYPKPGTKNTQFLAEVKYKDIGLWGVTGDYRPKLAIYEGDSHYMDVDNEQNENLRWGTRDDTFTFEINAEEGKNFVAVPFLYDESLDFRLMEDDGMPFATHLPTIACVNLFQTADMTWDDYYNQFGQKTTYFIHKYRAKVRVKGANNMEQWGIIHTWKPDQYGPEKPKEDHWTIDKLDDRDRSYLIDFTLRTATEGFPYVTIRPWCTVRYDGEYKIFSTKTLTLLLYNPNGPMSMADPDIEFGGAKGMTWHEDGGITTGNPNDVITIDSITPVD